MSVAGGPVRAVRVMAGATAVSRLLGFGRVLVVAAVLGTTSLGDVFSASNSVSNVIFDLLAAGALSAVLVPAFVARLESTASGPWRPAVCGAGAAGNGEADAGRLAGALLGWSLAVLGPLCVAAVVAAPALARLLVAGAADPAGAAAERHLATFLLRLFIPQVLLYAWGAVATAVLHAERRFVATAVAPIGNTVVMVGALIAFRVMHGGAAPGLELGLGEKLALGAAGTLGVVAFVGVPVAALRVTGFALRPRLVRPSAVDGLGPLARLCGWAGLQHSGTAVLLGTAIGVGMGVRGGVVAYQVAFAFFLVPYAVLSLPLTTAVLPELASEAAGGDLSRFAGALRWALDGMVEWIAPLSVAAVVLAPRLLAALHVGRTSAAGGRLIGVGLAGLAVGLVPYGAFVLFVRAHWALGEGRPAALTALGSAVGGAVVMAVAGLLTSGNARLAVMGGAHSGAYLVGAVVLGARLSRRTERRLRPTRLGRVLALSGGLGVAGAVALAAVDPVGRTATVAFCGVLGVAGALVYGLALRPAPRRAQVAGAGPIKRTGDEPAQTAPAAAGTSRPARRTPDRPAQTAPAAPAAAGTSRPIERTPDDRPAQTAPAAASTSRPVRRTPDGPAQTAPAAAGTSRPARRTPDRPAQAAVVAAGASRPIERTGGGPAQATVVAAGASRPIERTGGGPAQATVVARPGR